MIRRHYYSIPRSAFKGAFTLIEMIVVMVIFSILATLLVPRLAGNDQRQFKLAVEQVGDLLTMYAQREQLGQKPVGIFHDRQRNWLELMVMDTEDGLPGQIAQWRLDTYVKPVKLPQFMYDTDVDIFMDGDQIDAGDIPLSNELGKDRPTIQITLRGAAQGATLTLYPYGVAPEVVSDWANQNVARARIDLDGMGRTREDW